MLDFFEVSICNGDLGNDCIHELVLEDMVIHSIMCTLKPVSDALRRVILNPSDKEVVVLLVIELLWPLPTPVVLFHEHGSAIHSFDVLVGQSQQLQVVHQQAEQLVIHLLLLPADSQQQLTSQPSLVVATWWDLGCVP